MKTAATSSKQTSALLFLQRPRQHKQLRHRSLFTRALEQCGRPSFNQSASLVSRLHRYIGALRRGSVGDTAVDAAAAGGAAVGGAAAGGAAAGGIKSAFLSLAEPFNVTAPTSLVSRLQRSLTSGKLVRFSIPLQGLYKRQHCLTCCSIRTTGELTSTVPVLTRPLISAYNNPNTIGE